MECFVMYFSHSEVGAFEISFLQANEVNLPNWP